MRTPNRHDLLELLSRHFIWVVLAFTVVIFGLTIKGYLGLANIANILITGSVLGVMVIGQALCLMARKLDLSAEGTVSLVAVVAAWLMLPYRETDLAQAGGLGVELDPLIVIPLDLAAGRADRLRQRLHDYEAEYELFHRHAGDAACLARPGAGHQRRRHHARDAGGL